MRNTEKFNGRKILVVGLARSGIACANLLFDLGAEVSVTDDKDDPAIRDNAKKLKSGRVKLELGKHTKEFVKGNDLLIISPGVTNNAPCVVWAQELNIPVISEIELAWMLCPGEIIAVTGSNGKTTVTTLIGRILEKAGKRVFVCGNIGNPFSGEVEKIREGDFVSLEVSSFQLERIKDFKPKVAVMLNFTPNHLDRHLDMQEYLDAKKRIFMNQDASDFLVINSEDPVLVKVAKEASSKVIFFKRSESLNPNQAVVLAVGEILGVENDLAKEVLLEFKGLEHRMELVSEIKGVKFINDSKATTVESAIWAFKDINTRVIFIAGGRHKEVDYRPIRPLVKEKAREVILIGEASPIIKEALSGCTVISEVGSLDEAVKRASLSASPGDTVLFSPMCSSFDMFTNYEERGKAFKKAVSKLKGI